MILLYINTNTRHDFLILICANICIKSTSINPVINVP